MYVFLVGPQLPISELLGTRFDRRQVRGNNGLCLSISL